MTGSCPTCGASLQANSNTCYYCSPSPQTSTDSGPFGALQALGVLIVIVGFILMVGNMTGIFPTFPFAGFITMFIGGLLTRVG